MLALALVLAGCSPAGEAGDAGPDADRQDGHDGQGDPGDDGDAGGQGDDGGALDDDGGPDPAGRCAPLPPPAGRVLRVDPTRAGELPGLVAGLQPGDSLLLEDGTYALGGAHLWIATPEVSLRSASNQAAAVVLDGQYQTTEILTVAASDVTVAHLTLTRPSTHAIHVVTTAAGDTLRTRIHDVRVLDPGEQAIKVNPGAAGRYPDQGTISCCHLELSDAGRPHVNPTAGGCYTGGVDAHQARGWVIRDNRIQGFWCPQGLSEHAIHLWRGSRDTLVERNVLHDNARGIGFGLASSGEARTYPDAACPDLPAGTYVDHYLGIIRNNAISASSAGLFASEAGFDCGICLWSACGAKVAHNSVASTGALFSAIEWRFAGSRGIQIAQNAVTHALRPREDAQASLTNNLESAPLELFVDAAGGDLHLAPGATQAIDRGQPLEPGLCDDDLDGEARDAQPDLGADELRIP
jgi:hypothetical protein